MIWQLTPYAIPLYVGAVLLCGVAILAWSRGTTTTARYLVLTDLLIASYVFAYGMELGQSTVSGVLFWAKAEYLGVSLIPVTLLMMSLAYTGRRRWLTPRRVALLLAIPLLTIAIAWTNEWHEWIWSGLWMLESGPFYLAVFEPGAWYWVIVGYLYLLFTASVIILLRHAASAPPIVRRQTGILLVAMLVPSAVYLFYLVALAFQLPLIKINWQAYAFIVTALALSWGLLSDQLFSIVPLARHAVFDGMEDGVLVLDHRNRVLDINPTALRLLDWQREQVAGQPIKSLLDSEQWEAAKPYADVSRSRDEVAAHGRVYDMTISPLRRRGSKRVGRLVVLRDVSERARMIEELDAYAHTVAHDLKNPLAAVVGFAELITSEVDDDEPLILDLAGEIVQAGCKMARIVDEILLMASVRQKNDVIMTELEMGAVVAEALDGLAKQLREAEAIIEIPDRWPAALGYAPWLEAVWINLIDNALKHGGHPPRMVLGADDPADTRPWVRYWVRDNGQGIDPAFQAHLFMPFARGEVKDNRGHGVGLSTVRRIVARLGGRVGVESTVGAGSTFYFELPAGPAAGVTDNAVNKRVPTEHRSGGA